MLLLFFLLTKSLICQCGHIYIDDIHLTYQNEGYIQGIHFYFSLESGLEKNEIMSITLPLTTSPMIPYFLNL